MIHIIKFILGLALMFLIIPAFLFSVIVGLVFWDFKPIMLYLEMYDELMAYSTGMKH